MKDNELKNIQEIVDIFLDFIKRLIDTLKGLFEK